MPTRPPAPLDVDRLAWDVPAEDLDMASSAEVPPLDGLLAGEHGMATLAQGLAMPGPGYNVAVVGLASAQRAELLAELVAALGPRRRVGRDLAYAANLDHPHRPHALVLSAGGAARLQADLTQARDLLVAQAPGAVDAPETGGLGPQARGVVSDLVGQTLTPLRRRHRAASAWLGRLIDWLQSDPESVYAGLAGTDGAKALARAFDLNTLHASPRRGRAPIEHVVDSHAAALLGGAVNDSSLAPHMRVRAGALHRADGGVLLVDYGDLAKDAPAWRALLLAVRTARVEVHGTGASSRAAVPAVQPPALPCDVKLLVMVHTRHLGAMLGSHPDAGRLFKLRADFHPIVDYSPDVPRKVAGLVARMSKVEATPPMDAAGIARLVRWAGRDARRGGRVRLDDERLADLVREAAFEASRTAPPAAVLTDQHVQAALAARGLRRGRVERQVLGRLARGAILVRTTGTHVGEANGLAVYKSAGHAYGRPLRITANVSAGRGALVNIEREAGLSGKLHDKGVAVLVGLLRARFGRQQTLAMTASICFEQHYGRIDGDSASSAEVYALISALSGVPLRQDIAVTGSVDQRGNVLPIGSINQKIEGFHQVCLARGLTGSQGVLVPAVNVPDLALSDAVLTDCTQGRFSVWAIHTVEEGLRLLTGIEPGKPDRDRWPASTIYGRVARTLVRFEDNMRRATKGPSRAGKKAKSTSRPKSGAAAASPTPTETK